jgi:flavin reductase (DIM6/NTAB) family NADH-FMN oxidoreductase RutF
MRHLAGAVSIVTVGRIGERTGLTAVSATTLCAEIPALLVCVNLKSSAWPILCRQGCFGVNVLTARHEEVADRFAGSAPAPGEERYAGCRWLTLTTGAPLLAEALVALDCEVEETIERHGSAILIGRISGILSSDSVSVTRWPPFGM